MAEQEQVTKAEATAFKNLSTHLTLAGREFNELRGILKGKLLMDSGGEVSFDSRTIALWSLFKRAEQEKKRIDDLIDSFPEQAVILKAFDGDRKKNLESIADGLEKILDTTGTLSTDKVVIDVPEWHKIKGYMEQLRIIAAEMK